MSEPLEEIQDRVLDRLHAGEAPDREALLAAHPEHAEALGRFLDLLTEIEAPPPPASAKEPVRLGEFRILKERGRGGMGIVYEAEQASLKRRVALKVLPPALAQDPRVVARFRREAEAAGRLRHPNIVPVYSVGETGGTSFFAMELVEGRSLSEAIAERAAGRDAGLPPAGDSWRRWAVETGARIADALHYAHGQGILHRDIKPGNVLLEADGTPRLTDFGLALDLAAPGLTATGETFGTPLYMSPEQALRREAPLDPRTDVYSLGVTLYELLTLRPPYEGSSTAEILTALHLGRVVRPGDADPGMPEALERVLLRALRHDAADRYPTMGGFAEDLRNWLASRPVDAPPVPAAAPAPRTRKAVVTLSVSSWVAAAILLAVGGFLFLRNRQPSAVPTAGLELSGEDLRRLGAGEFPDGEKRLAAWLRPSVAMRSVVSRSLPGKYECRVDPGTTLDFEDDACSVAVLAKFEASVDGGPWKPLGIAWFSLEPGTAGSQNVTPSLAGVLGDSIEKGSVRLAQRAVCRIVARPPSWQHGQPPSREGQGSAAEAWAGGGGTSWTWTDERTLFVYDDFPATYPEIVSGPPYDDAMAASLKAARFGRPDLSKGSGRRSVDFVLHDWPLPGPLPLACEVDLLDPASGRAVGMMAFTREARGPKQVEHEGVTRGFGFAFELPEVPGPGEQKFLLDLVEGRAESVWLRFRPSRRVALEATVFERIWGGTAEAAIPSESASKSVASVVNVAPPVVAAPPVPAKGEKTWEAFRRLCEGRPLAGDPPLEEWVRPRVTLRSTYSTKQSRIWAYRCGACLDVPEKPQGAGPSDDMVLLCRWGRAIGDGTWEELGFSEATLSGGPGEVYLGVRELIRQFRVPSETQFHHRVELRLLPRPQGWQELRYRLDSAWMLPAVATGSWKGDLKVRVVEEFPTDFPVAVLEAPEGVQAAMARALTPVAVRRGVQLDGYRRRVGDEFGGGDEALLVFEVDVAGIPPVAIACDVDLYLEDDSVPIGTSHGLLLDPEGLEESQVAHDSIRSRLYVTRPWSEENGRAMQRADDLLAGGHARTVRLVYRPSRASAAVDTNFESYWGRSFEVTVPVVKE